jgi:hypothetical protein
MKASLAGTSLPSLDSEWKHDASDAPMVMR